MKLRAVFRIVFWAFLAILLTSLLVFGLSGELENLKRSVGLTDYDANGFLVYGDAAHFTDAGTGNKKDNYVALSALEIHTLRIEWVAGNVTLQNNERSNKELRIWEGAGSAIGDEADHLRYQYRDGVLTIKHSAPVSSVWAARRSISKQLKVEIPLSYLQHLKTVEINTISANITLKGLRAQTAVLQSVSGKVTLSNAIADDTKIDTTSGGVLLNFSAFDFSYRLHYETTLGELKGADALKKENEWLLSADGKQTVSVKTVGGSLELT